MPRWLSEAGATAVEYAIMVSLIAVVIVVGGRALGTNLTETYDCAASQVGALPDNVEC